MGHVLVNPVVLVLRTLVHTILAFSGVPMRLKERHGTITSIHALSSLGVNSQVVDVLFLGM